MIGAAGTPGIDIRPDQWAIARDIPHRHVPGHEVWAFGSRAKGTAKAWSDLDLVIIARTALPLMTRAALADDFSESDLPWKVDVVDWATQSEAFRDIIERDKVVVQPAEDPARATTSRRWGGGRN
jgi:predicted nucleotidyltransferase